MNNALPHGLNYNDLVRVGELPDADDLCFYHQKNDCHDWQCVDCGQAAGDHKDCPNRKLVCGACGIDYET